MVYNWQQNLMKRIITLTLSAFTLLLTVSCRSSSPIMPTAVSTVHSVSFDELNLTNKDYDILNRIEAQAVLDFEYDNDEITISDPEGSFKIEYKRNKVNGWEYEDYEGVFRAGFLANDYGTVDTDKPNPESFVRRLAIYRLINLVREQGGDGIIEPVISTSIEENTGKKNAIRFLTTVSGKVVRLKSSK